MKLTQEQAARIKRERDEAVRLLKDLAQKCSGKQPSTLTRNEKPQAPHWSDLELVRGFLRDIDEQ